LVLSLAWLGLALGGEEGEDGEAVVEEEEKEEGAEVLSDELREEDGVLVLHEHNFARALSEHRLLLVEFCKCPRCGQGRGQGGCGIVRWMRRRAGPSATLLQDAAAAAAFVSSQDLVVVGFFKVGWGGQGPHQPPPWQFDEGRTDFPVDPARGLDAAELTRLLRVHSLALVMEFTNETSDQIFSAKIPHHMLLFLNKSSPAQLALRDGFRAAAGTFRGEVLFVVVDVTGYGADVLPFFGMTPADAPTLRLVKMENNRKYRMAQDAFSDAAIRTFVQAVLDGKVKPHLMSAEPPEDWDTRPVKVLVGKTFEQVAFDETKNVFVKFYAPWCSHCQAMAAAWEELGERYKDHEDIVIAELDATANELENITISGFPTLHYFPAGPGRKMVEYKSARDVETFSKFLENGGTLPEEPPVVPKTPENSTGREEPSPLGTAESRDEL
ncbi:PDIA2 isomerase, partial [Sagittarius serpentarius]|nr:PDIA2 isomerase [Sagittarius serpentarius]